jgi:hypothetical protein
VTSLQRYLHQHNAAIITWWRRVQTPAVDAVIWCEELAPQDSRARLASHVRWPPRFRDERHGLLCIAVAALPERPRRIIVASRLSLDDHRAAALAAGADEFMPKTKFPQLIRWDPLIKRRLTPQF